MEDDFRKGTRIKNQAVRAGAAGGIGRDKGVAGIAGGPDKTITVFVFRPLDAQAGCLPLRQQVDARIRLFHPIKNHLIGIEILALRKIHEFPDGIRPCGIERHLGARTHAEQRRRGETFFASVRDDLLAELNFRDFSRLRFHNLHHIGSQKLVFTRGDFRTEIFHQNPPFEIVGCDLGYGAYFLIPQSAADSG